MTYPICDSCETVAYCMKSGCVPKQPAQQEPVAWQYRDARDDGTWGAWIGCDKRLAEDEYRQVRALYTSPPKQQEPVAWAKEYAVINAFYNSRRALRSQLLLMRHIDDGLHILQLIGASDLSKAAFCLHPIVQNSEAVNVSWSSAYQLACEYRDKANAYLCRPDTDWVTTPEDVRSVVGNMSDDCRAMLIADKRQNYGDFIAAHFGKHARSEQLDRYFRLWLSFLEGTSPQPAQRCSLCNYQHGHSIGCENNPVDIALNKMAENARDLGLDYEQPAPVQQEPVAALQRVMTRLPDLLDEDQFAEIEGIVARSGVAPPPQRNPLTDEQINAGRREWLYSPAGSPTAFKAGVRFAEAAHGIMD